MESINMEDYIKLFKTFQHKLYENPEFYASSECKTIMEELDELWSTLTTEEMQHLKNNHV